MTIRELTEDDLSQMLPIWNADYTRLTSSKREHTPESLRDWWRNRASGPFVYLGRFDRDALVAFMIVLEEPPDIRVKFLAVRDEFRRRGLAGELLAWARQVYKDADLYCEVLPDNDAALNFFSKHGFAVISECRDGGGVLRWERKQGGRRDVSADDTGEPPLNRM